MGWFFSAMAEEEAAVVGRGYHHLAVCQKLRRLGALGPPDYLILDGVELGQSLGHALGRAEHAVDICRRDTVGEQRPFEIVDGPSLQRALAGILLQVEHVGDRRGLLTLEDIGAVAEGRGIDDLRDEAVGAARRQSAGEEILRRRSPVRRRRQPGVRIDLHDQPLIARGDRVGRNHVDDIPGDVVRLHLRPDFGQTLGGVVVVDDVDVRIRRHVGIVIRLLLARRVGAAPRHDREVESLSAAGRQGEACDNDSRTQ